MKNAITTTPKLAPVMGNNWLRFVQDVDGDIVVITQSFIADEVQFCATIKPQHGRCRIVSFRRPKTADPVCVAIPIGIGKTFVFNEVIHDLSNLAGIEVFRGMHETVAAEIDAEQQAEQTGHFCPGLGVEGKPH